MMTRWSHWRTKVNFQVGREWRREREITIFKVIYKSIEKKKKKISIISDIFTCFACLLLLRLTHNISHRGVGEINLKFNYTWTYLGIDIPLTSLSIYFIHIHIRLNVVDFRELRNFLFEWVVKTLKNQDGMRNNIKISGRNHQEIFHFSVSRLNLKFNLTFLKQNRKIFLKLNVCFGLLRFQERERIKIPIVNFQHYKSSKVESRHTKKIVFYSESNLNEWQLYFFVS